jgi:hypothetical protein
VRREESIPGIKNMHKIHKAGKGLGYFRENLIIAA